jgi:hypothetical protein
MPVAEIAAPFAPERSQVRTLPRPPGSTATWMVHSVDEQRNPRTAPTVDQLLDRHLEMIDVSTSIHVMYQRYLDNHVRPFIGTKEGGRTRSGRAGLPVCGAAVRSTRSPRPRAGWADLPGRRECGGIPGRDHGIRLRPLGRGRAGGTPRPAGRRHGFDQFAPRAELSRRARTTRTTGCARTRRERDGRSAR